MIYGSVCSGIEAATQAWHPLGWKPAFFSEIDPFPRAVLQHHYPDVPLRGDFSEIQRGDHDAIDLLVGGTPCQSFSVAGLRGGLGDERGNLSLGFLRLADRLRPRWLVWENVPGVLSSNGGRDFGSILGGMVELGYGIAYRVLDAQYTRTRPFPWAVPQRRRRVFVVGYSGDWRRAAAVLFDRQSLQGHPPPRREAGQSFTHDVAPSLRASGPGFARVGDKRGQDAVVAAPVANSGDASYCITSNGQNSLDAETETLIAFDRKGTQVQTDTSGATPTIRSMSGAKSHANGGGQLAVAHALKGEGFDASEDGTGRGTPIVPTVDWRVRRLTPRECERLMGFPDDFTDVPWRGKPNSPDGRRYKALGNSFAVNVIQWIGERIQMVEDICAQLDQ